MAAAAAPTDVTIDVKADSVKTLKRVDSSPKQSRCGCLGRVYKHWSQGVPGLKTLMNVGIAISFKAIGPVGILATGIINATGDAFGFFSLSFFVAEKTIETSADQMTFVGHKMDTSIEELQARISQLESEKKFWEAESKRLAEGDSKNKDALENANQRVGTLENEVQRLNAKHQEAMTTIKTSDAALENLGRAINVNEDNLRALSLEHDAKQNAARDAVIEALRLKTNEFQAANHNERTNLAGLKTAAASIDDSDDKVQAAAKQMAETAANIQRQNEELARQMKEREAQMVKLDDKLSKYQELKNAKRELLAIISKVKAATVPLVIPGLEALEAELKELEAKMEAIGAKTQ